MTGDPTGSHLIVRSLCLTAVVGAKRLSLAIACALAVVPVTAASGASGDLGVSVSRLQVPAGARHGQTVRFAVRYVVRGAATRRANALVTLSLLGTSYHYRIVSNPTTVHPAIWSWSVTDRLPTALTKGSYKVVALVTLRRSGKLVSKATSTSTLAVS
jgi:hypothetical protein